jgi:hypothetical protein
MAAAELTHEIESKKLEIQRKFDAEKLKAYTLLQLVNNKTNPKRAGQTYAMIKAGVLEDRDGRICGAIVKPFQTFAPHLECPIEP